MTINQVSDQAAADAVRSRTPFVSSRSASALDTAPQLGQIHRLSPRATGDDPTALAAPTSRSRRVAAGQCRRDSVSASGEGRIRPTWSRLSVVATIPPDPEAGMNLADTKDTLLPSLNPEKTIKARVAGFTHHRRRRRRRRDDPLEPIMDAPDFPQPMYEALRDLSQDFLFPGLEHVPPNTVDAA